MPSRSSRRLRLALFEATALLYGSALLSAQTAGEGRQHHWRIMAVGDSITAGGANFASYRPLLWDKLHEAHVEVEFVGSQGFAPLRHEGYGGKTVEFLAERVPAHFAKTPADIVLLHAGHNHDSSAQPVPGMIRATGRLIGALRKINPHVIVLLAQVTPAGRLPKYAYIPELNAELARLAARLTTREHPVILVDQQTGYDWRTDTIEDHVHPNRGGAEKMAQRWFDALWPIVTRPVPSDLGVGPV